MPVAGYCRTNNGHQIEIQVEAIKQYANLNQLELSNLYLDEGYSGNMPLDERPSGLKLLDDAKEGKFDLLLIYKLDRLGRDFGSLLRAINMLKKYGVTIRSVVEPFDTSTPSGQFILSLLDNFTLFNKGTEGDD